MGELLAACVATTGSSARLRRVNSETLLTAGVEPWDLPVWFPQGEAQDTMHGARCLTRAGDRAQLPPGVRDRLRHLGRGLQTAAACPAAPGQAPVGLRLEVEARILAAL